MQQGSLSAAVSYDAPSVSSAGASNAASSGAASVTVVGQGGMGTSGSSAGSRVGHTACQASVWASSSGVACKAAGGLLGGAVGTVSAAACRHGSKNVSKCIFFTALNSLWKTSDDPVQLGSRSQCIHDRHFQDLQ